MTFLKGLQNAIEEKKAKGFNYFNIFDALGISGKENYHSAFIAYLLNQNAEHFQDIFASEFIKKFARILSMAQTFPKTALKCQS